MDLGLEVELDSDHEGGVLEVSVGPDGALEEVSYGPIGLSGNAGHGEVQTLLVVATKALVADEGGLLGISLGGRHLGWGGRHAGEDISPGKWWGWIYFRVRLLDCRQQLCYDPKVRLGALDALGTGRELVHLGGRLWVRQALWGLRDCGGWLVRRGWCSRSGWKIQCRVKSRSRGGSVRSRWTGTGGSVC